MSLQLKGHKGDVFAATACNGKICTGGHDKALYIWDPSIRGEESNKEPKNSSNTEKTSTMQLIQKYKDAHEHIISCLETYHGPAFIQPLLISGSWDGNIIIWDLNYRKGSTRISTDGSGTTTTAAAATTIPSSNSARGGMRYILKGHTHRIKSLSTINNHLLADIPRLVSGSDDLSIRVWNLSSGECLFELNNVHKGFVLGVAMISSLFCCYRTSLVPRWDSATTQTVNCDSTTCGDSTCGDSTCGDSTPPSAKSIMSSKSDQKQGPLDHPLIASCSTGGELIICSAYDGKILWRRCSSATATAKGATAAAKGTTAAAKGTQLSDVTCIQFCYSRNRGQSDVTNTSDSGGGSLDSGQENRMLCCGDSNGHIIIYNIIESSRTQNTINLEMLHDINSNTSFISTPIGSTTSKITGLSLSLTSSKPLLISVDTNSNIISWDVLKGVAGGINIKCTNNIKKGTINSSNSDKEANNLLACSCTLATTGTESGIAAGMRSVPGMLESEKMLDEYVVVTGTNGLVWVYTISTIIQIDNNDKKLINQSTSSISFEGGVAANGMSSVNIKHKNKDVDATDNIPFLNGNKTSDNDSNNDVELQLPTIDYRSTQNDHINTEKDNTKSNIDTLPSIHDKEPILDQNYHDDNVNTAKKVDINELHLTDHYNTGGESDEPVHGAVVSQKGGTLLEKLQMDGGPDEYSLGFGVPDAGLSPDGSPKVTEINKNEQPSHDNDMLVDDTAITSNDTNGVPLILDTNGNSTQVNTLNNVKKGKGQRGMLSIGGNGDKKVASTSSSSSSSRSPPRNTNRTSLLYQKRREVKQVSNTPAYCLLEPKARSSTMSQLETASQLVDSLSRTRLAPGNSSLTTGRTGEIINNRGEKLFNEIQGAYGGPSGPIGITLSQTQKVSQLLNSNSNTKTSVPSKRLVASTSGTANATNQMKFPI